MKAKIFLAQWPSIKEAAKDMQLPYHVVYFWHRRDNIPAWRLDSAKKAAKKRKYDFSGI